MRRVENPDGGRPIRNEDLRNFEPLIDVFENMFAAMGLGDCVIRLSSQGAVVVGIAYVQGVLAVYELPSTTTMVRRRTTFIEPRDFFDGVERDATRVSELVADPAGTINFSTLPNMTGRVLQYMASSDEFDGQKIRPVKPAMQNVFRPNLNDFHATRRVIPAVGVGDVYGVGYVPAVGSGGHAELNFILTGDSSGDGALSFITIAVFEDEIIGEVHQLYGSPTTGNRPRIRMHGEPINVGGGVMGHILYIQAPQLTGEGAPRMNLTLIGDNSFETGNNITPTRNFVFFDTFLTSSTGITTELTYRTYYTASQVDSIVSGLGLGVFDSPSTITFTVGGQSIIESQSVRRVKYRDVTYVSGYITISNAFVAESEYVLNTTQANALTNHQYGAGSVHDKVAGVQFGSSVVSASLSQWTIRSANANNSAYLISNGTSIIPSGTTVTLRFSIVIVD